jgi:DNA polymerase-3 subunit delta
LHNGNYPSDFDLKINGFSSKKVQLRNKKASSIWNFQQVQKCISLLSSTDMQLRSMGTTLEENIIQTMIYEIIVKKGSKITEYQLNLEDF